MCVDREKEVDEGVVSAIVCVDRKKEVDNGVSAMCVLINVLLYLFHEAARSSVLHLFCLCLVYC